MSDDRLHSLECQVRLGHWISQNTGSIKDIQPLVLHRSHIEVIDGNNHKNIKIVLSAVFLLIPAHGAFKRFHRMTTLVDILVFDKYLKLNRTSSHSGKGIIQANKVSRNKRKQVAGLHKWVFPCHPMPIGIFLGYTRGNVVAITQQNRVLSFFRDNRCSKN